MPENENDVTWTAKLPALIAGAALILAGLVSLCGRWKYAAIGGALLILAGVGFVGWSLSIKEWCVVNERSAFSSAFSPSLRGCLRQKGWLEL